MSSKKKQASREKILKFALIEFSRLGAAGARMDNIARRAKISKGRIYYHFKDKDELFAAVLQSAFEQDHALRAVPESPVDSIRFWNDFYRNNKEWSRLLIREGLEGQEQKVPHREAARKYWKAAVEKMRDEAGPGRWPEFLDQAHLLLSLIAIEMAPIALPNLARLITGKDPDSAEFQRDRMEFLRTLAQFAIDQAPPRSKRSKLGAEESGSGAPART
jgi:TetR/AcrR family transcriptional regulator